MRTTLTLLLLLMKTLYRCCVQGQVYSAVFNAGVVCFAYRLDISVAHAFTTFTACSLYGILWNIWFMNQRFFDAMNSPSHAVVASRGFET